MQFSQNSPPISNLDDDKDPVQVSQFFLDDIFTEVVDPDWFLFETFFTAAIPVHCTGVNMYNTVTLLIADLLENC